MNSYLSNTLQRECLSHILNNTLQTAPILFHYNIVTGVLSASWWNHLSKIYKISVLKEYFSIEFVIWAWKFAVLFHKISTPSTKIRKKKERLNYEFNCACFLRLGVEGLPNRTWSTLPDNFLKFKSSVYNLAPCF